MTCSDSKKKKCYKYDKVVTNEICGKINQVCNSKPKVIWRAIGVQPSGTIKVTNSSDYIMVLLIKSGKKLCTSKVIVYPRDEITLTIALIHSIEVECIGKHNEMCTGSFILCIQSPCTSLEVEDDCHNDFCDDCYDKCNDRRKIVVKKKECIPNYNSYI